MNLVSRVLLCAALLAGTVRAAEPHAYLAARIALGNGTSLDSGVLVVQEGKIVAVGRRAEVKLPANTVTHDLGSAVLIPGLVIAETSLAEKGRDDVTALSPDHRAADGYDPYGDYSSPLAGGVTTVGLVPGGRRLLPGQVSVVKLAGDDPTKRLLREEESLRVMLGEGFKNPPRIYEPPVGAVSVDRPLEPTRPQLAGSLTAAVAGLRATFRAARETPQSTDPVLRAVATSGTTRKPVRITSPGAADVAAALGLAKEFGLRLVLVEPPFARDRLSEWKTHVEGVILTPGLRPGNLTDGDAGPPAEAVQALRAAGLRVALKPIADADLKEMLYLTGLLTTRLSADEALRLITGDAATLLGVADRVGTLTVGKDADFVVLNGPPFGLHTRVQAVHVDGKIVHGTQTSAPRKVIRAGRILTGTGEMLTNGGILVDGGTIRALGRGVSVPPDAELATYPNGVIVPGFLDLGTTLGVGGPLTSAIAVNTRLSTRLVSGDPAVATARRGGVSTVLLSSTAASPGPVVAFKLTDRLKPIKDPVAIRFAIRGNLTSQGALLRDQLRAGKAYTEGWAKYETALAEYERQKKAFDEAAKPVDKPATAAKPSEKPADKVEKKPEAPKPPEKPQVVDSLESLRPLFTGTLPALVEAHREDAVRLAISLFRDEFSLRTILVGAGDAHRLADLLAAKSVAVIAGPELVRTVEHAEVDLPLALALRGVPTGFQSQAGSGARNLYRAVGYAVRHGLGADEALQGLTSAPARFLGLPSLGTLATGKDADLVVLSGSPFEPSTRIVAVMIDGQWVHRETE